MRLKTLMPALLALGLSGLTADACLVVVRVACPNDNTASGIRVCIDGVGCADTDNLGIAQIQVPAFGPYNVCVDTTTLPAGATLSPACQTVTVTDEVPSDSGEPTCIPALTEFVLGGDFCSGTPPQGKCWMTGGGTIGSGKKPDYSYGGVVYPGCSPAAAGGGNWNVVAHKLGLHFQGQDIIVDNCSGVATKSPKVNVNIIDFHGTGRLFGVGGNKTASESVTFVGRGIDVKEPGHHSDMLFVSVSDASGVVLQIGDSVDSPAVVSTGNIQIHTSSCGK